MGIYYKSLFSVYDVKLIAAFVMVLDHLGVIYDILSFRWVGRFAFPLFGYLFVNGIRYTSSFEKYYWRLLVFALISQVPYSLFLMVNGISTNLNILFLLVAAFPVIYYFKFRYWLGVLIFGLLACFFVFRCDYGFYGLGLLLSIYLFSEHFLLGFVNWAGVNVYGALTLINYQSIILFLPLFFPDIQKLPLGKKARWFYWFYPLHFIPLIVLKYYAASL